MDDFVVAGIGRRFVGDDKLTAVEHGDGTITIELEGESDGGNECNTLATLGCRLSHADVVGLRDWLDGVIIGM